MNGWDVHAAICATVHALLPFMVRLLVFRRGSAELLWRLSLIVYITILTPARNANSRWRGSPGTSGSIGWPSGRVAQAPAHGQRCFQPRERSYLQVFPALSPAVVAIKLLLVI